MTLLDERVQDVEDRMDIPDGWMRADVGDIVRLQLGQIRPEIE